MKKFFCVFVLIFLCSLSVVNAENMKFKKKSSNEIGDFNNIGDMNMELFNNKVVFSGVKGETDLDIPFFTEYSNDKSSDISLNLSNGKYYINGENIYYIYNGVYDGEKEEYVKSPTIYKYDKNYNEVASYSNKRFTSWSTFIEFSDDDEVFLLYGSKLGDLDFSNSTFEKGACYIYEFDDNLSNEKSIDCTRENIGLYFPKMYKVIENDLSEENIDIFEKQVAMVVNGNLKVYYEDKLLFEQESGDLSYFTKPRLFKDKVLVLKNTQFKQWSSEDASNEIYFSKLLVYSLEGDLLQTISGTSVFYDYDIDLETGDLFILNSYSESPFRTIAYGYAGHSSFTSVSDVTLCYELYNYGVVGGILGNNFIQDIVKNPETRAFVSLAVIIFCLSLGCFILLVKGKRKLY